MELSEKQECWEGHEQALIKTIRKETEKQKSWRKLDTDHQRGQYYKHCSRSIVPRELKERVEGEAAMSAPPSPGDEKKDQR